MTTIQVSTGTIVFADRHDTGGARLMHFEDCVKAVNPDPGYHLLFEDYEGRIYHHRHTFPFGSGLWSGVTHQPEADARRRVEALLDRVEAAGSIDLAHWVYVRSRYGSPSWDEEGEAAREREDDRWAAYSPRLGH